MNRKISVIFAMIGFFMAVDTAFAFQLEVVPQISVSEEYTDNLFASENNEEEEFITIISPTALANLEGMRAGATLSYNPSYSLYSEYSEYNTLRHQARFSAYADMASSTRLEINDSFLFTEEPIEETDTAALTAEDPSIEIDTTVRQGRETYYTNTSAIGLVHQFGELDSITLRYSYSLLENDDPEYNDNRRHQPTVGLTYWVSSNWGVNIHTGYTKGESEQSDDVTTWEGSMRIVRMFTRQLNGFFQYSHTVNNYDGETEDFKIHNPAVGVDVHIEEDVSLALDIGYFINRHANGDEETGLTSNGSLIKRFQRGSLILNGSAGYEDASFGAENLGFSEFYETGCSATYDFTRRLTGSVFGSYRHEDYRNEDPTREDKIARAGMRMTFHPLRFLSASLEYTHRTVESTEDENEYKENRGMLTFTISPPRPCRIK